MPFSLPLSCLCLCRLAQSLFSRPPKFTGSPAPVLYLVHIDTSGDSISGPKTDGQQLLDSFCIPVSADGTSFVDLRRLVVPISAGGLVETMQEHVSQGEWRRGAGFSPEKRGQGRMRLGTDVSPLDGIIEMRQWHGEACDREKWGPKERGSLNSGLVFLLLAMLCNTCPPHCLRPTHCLFCNIRLPHRLCRFPSFSPIS